MLSFLLVKSMGKITEYEIKRGEEAIKIKVPINSKFMTLVVKTICGPTTGWEDYDILVAYFNVIGDGKSGHIKFILLYDEDDVPNNYCYVDSLLLRNPFYKLVHVYRMEDTVSSF